MKQPLVFEYVLAIGLVAGVLALYVIAFVTINSFLALLVALFSSLLGAFLVPFGFWGADFAFDALRRNEKFVYVPFLGRKNEGMDAKPDARGRNYTPLEWWNLNWFFITLGVGLLAIGLFVTGYVIGKMVA